ncbi:hypothetical protein [uncultured Litoreibacter sp.]|uniref:hypothetical protein n=1 Tax=uncultured Litoreibacter sp. TaxID=1392394 RepID=UPI002633CC9D|nr:hypothetical protein [uncultured Litoreibacter sp.]
MTDFEAATQELDLERQRLENEKLRAEIEQVSLSWWKRPGYLGSMTPVLIALAGVFTAWVSGYFDTQRTQLSNDIVALEADKMDLTQGIADAQKIIDLGYLRIRMAAQEASYALGHFGSFSEEFSNSIQTLNRLSDAFPDEGISAVNTLTDAAANRFNIVQITEESLEDLTQTVQQIDASDWAKELQTGPFLTSLELFESEDGCYFDVGLGLFLSDEQAKEKLGDSPLVDLQNRGGNREDCLLRNPQEPVLPQG